MGKGKVKVWYDEETDILYISLKKGVAVDSEETEEGVRMEYGPDGEILGVEVADISRLLSRAIAKHINE
ncbi:MAG: DUF2283 domain-containing protein, partial [Candidatus Aenigmatarchaeota archaeon]